LEVIIISRGVPNEGTFTLWDFDIPTIYLGS
jgi:hypothetical protein